MFRAIQNPDSELLCKRTASRFTDPFEMNRIEGADKWFDYFDQSHIQESLAKFVADKTGSVKVAVLDTGIDLQDYWISTKAGRIKCWPTKKSCKDTDGHGTHVAYLLLRLAPHIQLHVAKISISQKVEDADIEAIAKVRSVLFKLKYALW